MDQVKTLRNLIDSIDSQLLELISSRADLVKEIGKLKKQNNLSVIDKKRETEIFEKISRKAQEKGLDEKAIKKIWKNLIDISYKLEGAK